MPNAVNIWWDCDVNAYRMVTPYNENFLALIKQLVPSSDRLWDEPKGSKQWTITERYLENVRQLAERLFKTQATVVNRAQAEAKRASQSTSGAATAKHDPADQAIIKFFRLLPYEAARKAYILGAAQLHPDKGGSLDMMTEFNATWQHIEREVFKK